MIPKFKAFLKETKQIVDVETIHFELGVVKVNGIELYHFEDIILMQSTGLHDNTKFKDLSNEEQEEWLESGKTADDWKGREIFEGDIVEYLDGEFSYKGVVTQDSVTCWWIKGIEPDDNFSFGDVTDYTYHTCDLVVKGNIYENPELLEAT